MILLTDEEITRIVERATPPRGSYRQDIAKAQLKQVGEWGDETCEEHPLWVTQGDITLQGIKPLKRECGRCWQALLEEVK